MSKNTLLSVSLLFFLGFTASASATLISTCGFEYQHPNYVRTIKYRTIWTNADAQNYPYFYHWVQGDQFWPNPATAWITVPWSGISAGGEYAIIWWSNSSGVWAGMNGEAALSVNSSGYPQGQSDGAVCPHDPYSPGIGGTEIIPY